MSVRISAADDATSTPARNVPRVSPSFLGREVLGTCSNHGECEAVFPKGIPLEFIAGLNRDVIRAAFRRRREPLRVASTPQHAADDDV